MKQDQKRLKEVIRTMVRTVYDFQKLRIQLGNRIAMNFKRKLGQEPGMPETEMEKESQKTLAIIRKDHQRITDGIIKETKTLKEKDFKPHNLITEYSEFLMVDNYVKLLLSEAKHFKDIGVLLKKVPLYTEFLENVAGIGPAMGAVLYSEIDIHKAEYPSSLWKYAGMDTVTIGYYVDNKGTEHSVHWWEIMDHVERTEGCGEPMYVDGCEVKTHVVARSRKKECLVKKLYVTFDGKEALRDGLSYNPFLKTKIVGVLGPGFLKAGSVYIDGARMGGSKRLALAVKEGFQEKAVLADEVKDAVISFLISKGYSVHKEGTKYSDLYYSYKHRISHMPEHQKKTPKHIHNMAIRYAVKIFLNDLYAVWRKMENLPVAPTYAEAKLGLVHHDPAHCGVHN